MVLEDHNFTEDYIKESGLIYRFVRDSNYAEAILDTVMDSNFETGKWVSNQGAGKVAYITREDCAKAIAAVAMGIPRTTEDMKNSPWPWCSEDMVSCGAAVRNKKMEIMTDDYENLVGEKPMSLKQLFQRKYNK